MSSDSTTAENRHSQKAPNEEFDVFISYAHIDNQPLDSEQEGWISELNRRLKIRLSQYLGEEARIWRDPKLGGNDEFAEVIEAKLINSRLLLSVLSPRYVKSDWCRRELQHFHQTYHQQEALKVGSKYRIFKVMKYPVARDQHPEEVQPMLGYEFFEEDPSTGHPQLYDPELGKERSLKFQLKLDELAQDITKFLENLENPCLPLEAKAQGPIAPSPDSSSRTIYLAETSSDLTDQRDTVKRELQQRGYTVLPDTAVSYASPACEQAITAMLDRSCLSIHLIGSRYGLIPEGSGQSIVALQVELAARRAYRSPDEGDPFRTLLWMPRDLHSEESQQRELMASLRNDPHLVQSSLESFKTIVLETLEGKAQASGRSAEHADDEAATTIYLLFDKEDVDAIQPIYDDLLDRGFDVVYPDFDEDEATASEQHQGNLCSCDAVLIYYGQGKEKWLKAKYGDLRKAPGYGRSKPFLAQAVVQAPPLTTAKKMLRAKAGEPDLIQAFEGFTPDSLAGFLAAIKEASSGQSR